MKNYHLTGRKPRSLRCAAALILVSIVAFLFALTGIASSSSSAHSANFTFNDVYCYTEGAQTLDFSVDGEYSTVYDVDLSLGDAATTPTDNVYRSGNFYSPQAILFDKATNDGKTDYRITDSSMQSTTLYADMPIPKEGDLAAAIRDKLVTVRASLYFVWGDHAEDSPQTVTANGTLAYYRVNGAEAVSQSTTGNILFSNNDNAKDLTEYFTLGGFTFESEYDDAGTDFFRLTITNFNHPAIFTIAFRRVGIRLEILRATGGVSMRTVGTEVIDSTGRRNANAAANEVKSGDVILFTNELYLGTETLDVDRSVDYDHPTSATGRFYRKLFLRGSTEDFFSYSYRTNEFSKTTTRIVDGNDEPITYEKGGDVISLADDHSGYKVAFLVEDSSAVALSMVFKLWTYTGEETGVSEENIFYLDNSVANQPFLTENAFSTKYVGLSGKSYFTDEASYVKGTDENADPVVVQIDLGAVALSVRPEFTENSLRIRGGDGVEYFGSAQTIYYKVTAWRNGTSPRSSDEQSDGFDLAEATGIYCTVTPQAGRDPVVSYGQLLLTMPTSFDGVLTTYDKQAIFGIEFVTVDYVGNLSYCTTRYIIRVDVTDYSFVYFKRLAINSDDNAISNSDCTVTFTTLDEYNRPKARTSSDAVFKRGDKVLAYVKLTSSARNKYILTGFTTGGGVYINTEKFSSDSSGTISVAQSETAPYSFIVDSKYFDDEAKRVINFSFKFRATLSITGREQSYSGYEIKVNVTPMYGGTKITGNARVTTTYSSTANGEYTANGPVNVGTYYVRCELKNNDTYYGYETTTLTVSPATPRLSRLIVDPINYGGSLALIDFDQYATPSEINVAVHSLGRDGNYYSDRSYDGVYGYFKVNEVRLGTGGTYGKPSAGTLSLPLTFVPIKTETDELGRTVYSRDENGKFIEDGNYSRIDDILVDLTVNYSTAVSVTVADIVDNTVKYEYDGSIKELAFTIVSTLKDASGNNTSETGMDLSAYTRVIYRTDEQGEAPVLLEEAPKDAGRYTATVRLLSGGGCNYTGSFTYAFVIEKRALHVEGYSGVTTFDFQQESPFTPSAYYGSGSSKVPYAGLKYAYTYYFFNGGSAPTSAVDEALVPEGEIFVGTGMPQYAGQYVAKVEIDEKNFENAEDYFIRFNIRQADASYPSMVMTAPTVAFNSSARTAHVNYLQQLKAIVLSGNQNTGVNFEYHVYQRNVISYEARKLEGRFVVTQRTFRAEGYQGESVESFLADTQSYDGFDVGRHAAYIYFIPADGRNFLPIGRQTEIIVGKATPDLTEVTLTPITYGKAVASVSDLTVSENVRVSVGGNEYRTLDKSSETEGYEYSLVGLENARLYPAGDNYVVVRVTPVDPERFSVVNETLVLRVEKQDLSIDFASSTGDDFVIEGGYRVYTYPYGGAVRPAFSFVAVENGRQIRYADGEISGSLAFAPNEGENYVVDDALTLDTLPIGSYYAVYTVTETNFAGEIVYRYEITKDDLVVESLPSIYNRAEFVTYNNLLEDAVFYSGSMVAKTTGKKVSGTYAFRYPAGTRFTDTGMRRDYYLTFTPDDESYNACETSELKLSLIVGKKDVGNMIGLTISAPVGGFTYGLLTAESDLLSYLDYTVPVYTDGTSYKTEPAEGFVKLNADITVSGLPGRGYLPVGNYPVTVTISDDNYSGTFTDEGIQVGMRPAKIVLYADQNGETNEKIFRNRNQSVSYAVFAMDEEGEYTVRVTTETVAQSFVLNGNSLRSAPVEIGKYNATLSLRSNNYSADDLSTEFTIKVDPAQIRVNNLEQTYNVPRAVAVSLGLNDAVYTLSYVGREDGVTYETLPTEAGQYVVRLTFAAESNNGYAEAIDYRENGEIRYLNVNKYKADVIVNDPITVNYTGYSYDLRPSTDPYGLNLLIEYQREGSDEWTTEEVFDANLSDDTYHLVRFTVVEKNYTGQTVVRYHVNKSALTVVTPPVFDAFVYNGDVAPALLEKGRVDFNDRLDLDGKYTLDLTAIDRLPVGRHRINYTFTAYDGEEIDKNFRPVVGQCDLSVVKRTLSDEDFVLGETSGNIAEYDGNGFGVDAKIRDGRIVDPDGANADFRLIVYYNDNVNPPRDPGLYTVRVVVSSKNYQGEYVWDRDLIINKGKPYIAVKPAVLSGRTYSRGDVVTTADLEPTGGRATIRGKEVNVSGDFTLVSTTLEKANYNDVEVIFSPNDTERFESVSFYVTFFAVGENPLPGVESGESWDGKDISAAGGSVRVVASSNGALAYGAKLRAFTLSFVGDAEAVEYLDQFGLLSFVDPDFVPGAGDVQAEVVYKPYGQNADAYTIMNGTVNVRVEKAELTDVDVRVISYYDRAFSDSTFLLYRNGEVVQLDGAIVSYYSDEERTISIDDMTVSENRTVYYLLRSDNYVDYAGEIEVKAVDEIASENIEVGRREKAFDGRSLSVSDLYIRILNTATPVLQSDITLAVYSGDEISDGKDVGEYTVYIYVENDLVYGSAQTTFTVQKRDVSSELSLDRDSSYYGAVVAPKVTLDGQIVDVNEYSVDVKYKLSSQSESAYNANLPVRAGEYDVKVTVDGENYAGVAVFTYTVMKLPVRLVADSTYYYGYGAAQSLSVSFRSAEGNEGVDLEYSVYYYSKTYSMSKVVPQNAGNYVARIILEERDYSISGLPYAEVGYVINRMNVTITEDPTPLYAAEGYHLVYGQRVGELALAGGLATRNDVAVEGRFFVEDDGDRPNAGTYYATVRFVPTDKNYSEATTSIPVIVGQASATVTFTKLSAPYTGSSRRNALEYVVNPAGVSVNILFVNSLGERLTAPVAAGTYSLVVTSNDDNYRVTSTLDRFGNTAVFTIAKAAVKNIVDPRANPLQVGESVEKSSVVSGEDFGLVYYEGFANPINGVFTFLASSIVFTKAGVYDVEYIFSPTDGNNFAEGRGTTTITVNKAVATITVSNNVFTYASGFSYPTFTTYPAGLAVKHDVTMREYDPTASDYVFDERDYVDVGVYEFHAWVDDENYLSDETVFRIYINKKKIDLDFVDGGETVQQYSTTYGITPEVKFTLYPAGTPAKTGYLLKDEVKNGVRIDQTYEINYRANEVGLVFDDHRAPVEIGTYTVTVTLINNNYTAEKTVLYKINKGKITNVSFDRNSMEKQVYGAVTEPIVLTEPSGVQYRIIYHGTDGGLIPKDAGSYNVTVQFNDEHYESMQVAAKFKIAKKSLVVTGITVSDKTYDGTSSLAITGTLYGVLPGDEISVKMTAETADGSTSVGSHYVSITSCKLSGLQADNYELTYPTYSLPVTIFGNKVASSDKSNSFITSTTGFVEGTTVEFTTINTVNSASTFFENLTGRSSKVIGYTVKENGSDALVSEVFKVYVEIPADFVDAKFDVKGVGALQGKNVVFSREGNYITFYASSSGQVQFKKTEFSYVNIVILISIGIVLIALVALLVVTPIVRRKKLMDDRGEKAYAKRARRGY